MFDGYHPRLWISRCEIYFDMFHVDPIDWIRVASMHVSPAVACWFQSVERKYPLLNWPLFCSALHERYGKDQYQLLLRQLFRIKQLGSVAEYIDQFSTLVDQLSAYESVPDPLFFSTRFVDGLRDDLRAVVLVQRPSDLDTACALALLQEEVAEPAKRKDFRKPEAVSWGKYSAKNPLPLPAPPPSMGSVKSTLPVDQRSLPAARSVEDKVSALRAFRRAKGLCDRCAEKWHRGHTCATTVQLQAIQEVWELFNVEELQAPSESGVSPEDHLFLAISAEAVSGAEGKRSMQLLGEMNGCKVHILIDSGSTNSFISQQVVDHMPALSLCSANVQVKVANGGLMACVSAVSQATWTIQGCVFQQQLKILPLQSYDIILGMDWLEHFSPMKVHWRHKWMIIPYAGSSAVLQGQSSDCDQELLIQINTISQQSSSDGVSELHPDIAKLLEQFQVVFASPTALPPVRDCDHSIPLIPGAPPFTIRPYRYPPSLKDEIERQVAEMVQLGIIRPSSSPFSSPVLLVRKKDGTFRFCVDYRYLNALTLKGKFPIPVFDQLMDELAGASWFTTLDLISGYHQVRLKPGEEYKTAFQTHHGQFEFLVMAFGLSGAPGTFQGAMNSTLAPLLRRCVIVFFDDILIYSKSFEDHITHLKEVLTLLQQHQWHVKLSKCKFAQREISYLGHRISQADVSTDEAKVEAIVSWPMPTSVKELRSFLGLAGYYRKFVKHFAVIAKPLTDLLKKGVLFVWTQDQELAFATLKQALSSAPVLALPDFSRQFCIETDACKNGVGAVLIQDGHPLAFISKPLGVKTQGLSTYEKEYLAILIAIEQWRSYLLHAEFIIFTDQKSLVHLNEQRLNTPW